MVKNLYLILVVIFRLVGIYIGCAAIVTLIASIFTGFVLGMAFLTFMGCCSGILLWYVAKPLAKLITNDLE